MSGGYIATVTKQDIKDVLARPLARKANRMANIMLSNFKQFFRYADDEELIVSDPTRRLTKDRVGGKENPKERHLSEAEIKLLANKFPHAELQDKYIHAFWFLLATGCRVNEVQRCRKKDIDLEKGTFSVPDIHAKNKRHHIIYLSDFALTHIKVLLDMTKSQWLFPSNVRKGPISKQTITKQFTDRQRVKRIKGRTKLNQTLVVPGGRWTSHDLRRTAASIMQELGVMPHIIKKCLNQKPGDKLEEVYQRAEMRDHQKEAFYKLGAFLELLYK